MEIVLTLFGAVIGIVFDRAFQHLQKKAKRKDPLIIKTSRSYAPPVWIATNLALPKNENDEREFDEYVFANEPFCSFAKIVVDITNKSDDVIYLTDILVTKELADVNYKTRVRNCAQGGGRATRLFAILDDPVPLFVEDPNQYRGRYGGYFERGERIMIAPAETERIVVTFIAMQDTWRFNCNIKFTVNGSERLAESIFESDEVIVPLDTDTFENDYCSFLEHVNPQYEKFSDAAYFSPEMKNTNYPYEWNNPKSTLEYLALLTK